MSEQGMSATAKSQGAMATSNKREAKRIQADFVFEYRLAGRDGRGVGRALDHSETGINFVTDRPLEPGSSLTVRVPLRSQQVPVLTCLAAVVRCLTLPNGNGYAVGCAYD